MNDTDDALTKAVRKAIAKVMDEHHVPEIPMPVHDMATAAIAAVRAHDEQAALNCGHCTPNTDEIACGCQIEERDDE